MPVVTTAAVATTSFIRDSSMPVSGCRRATRPDRSVEPSYGFTSIVAASLSASAPCREKTDARALYVQPVSDVRTAVTRRSVGRGAV